VGLSRDTPDYHQLIVLNMILGGQFVSRINMKLRQEKGLTYGARTAFDFRRGRGPFILQTSVQSDGTGEAIRSSLLEIDAIRTDRPPTAEEVEVAKAALTRGYPRNFETAEQIARAMAQLVLYGLPDDYFDTFTSRVSGVTVDGARQGRVNAPSPGPPCNRHRVRLVYCVTAVGGCRIRGTHSAIAQTVNSCALRASASAFPRQWPSSRRYSPAPSSGCCCRIR
jgi:hypothetical protein